MKKWIVTNQQKIATGIGYLLVFLLAFGIGRISVIIPDPPEISIEEPKTFPQPNSTSNIKGIQSQSEMVPVVTGGHFAPEDGQCAGKIKGNIGSSGKIYHIPGGSFYERTNAEECFETEQDAVAAGYRKSSR